MGLRDPQLDKLLDCRFVAATLTVLQTRLQLHSISIVGADRQRYGSSSSAIWLSGSHAGKGGSNVGLHGS